MSEPKETSTCCRSEEGITVGLIDGIIAMARVIRERVSTAADDGVYSEAVHEALKDLRSDDDMGWLMNFNIEGGVKQLLSAIAEKDKQLDIMTRTLAAILAKD